MSAIFTPPCRKVIRGKEPHPLLSRIIFALLALMKIRHPQETDNTRRANLNTAIDHLHVGKWCINQSQQTPRHAEVLLPAAEEEYEAAKQIVQKVNAAKSKPGDKKDGECAAITIGGPVKPDSNHRPEPGTKASTAWDPCPRWNAPVSGM